MSDLNTVLDRLHPGTAVAIRYLHHTEEKSGKIVPQENPAFVVETFESAGLPVTPAILQFRQHWLGAK
jgi:hypothetical protein